jgi:hypothetical protein
MPDPQAKPVVQRFCQENLKTLNVCQLGKRKSAGVVYNAALSQDQWLVVSKYFPNQRCSSWSDINLALEPWVPRIQKLPNRRNLDGAFVSFQNAVEIMLKDRDVQKYLKSGFTELWWKDCGDGHKNETSLNPKYHWMTVRAGFILGPPLPAPHEHLSLIKRGTTTKHIKILSALFSKESTETSHDLNSAHLSEFNHLLKHGLHGGRVEVKIIEAGDLSYIHKKYRVSYNYCLWCHHRFGTNEDTSKHIVGFARG